MPVGLVIVTYNAEVVIGQALDAVARQTLPPDAVVLVDNASTDGTLAAVDRATRAWPVPIHVIGSARNLGFAAANNRAVERLSTCDVIALLNPDAVPEPGWLAALVGDAQRHPEAASFASRLMAANRPGVLDGAGDACHVSGLAWRRHHGRVLVEVPEASTSGAVFAACAAAALYRRDDWVAAGGMDERFFCYMEDVDLGFRLQLAGRGCRYVAGAVASHAGWSSSGRGSAFAVYHGHRNLVWTFVKNMPARLLWRYLPLHVALGLAGAVFFAARGVGLAYLRGKWDACRGLPAAWRARRSVQAARVIPDAAVAALLERGSLLPRLRQRLRG